MADWCQELGLTTYLEYQVGTYSLDIYLPELKLGVELDGITHSRRKDHKRDTYIQNRHNIEVIRFKNKEIAKMNKEDFFTIIEAKAELYED